MGVKVIPTSDTFRPVSNRPLIKFRGINSPYIICSKNRFFYHLYRRYCKYKLSTFWYIILNPNSSSMCFYYTFAYYQTQTRTLLIGLIRFAGLYEFLKQQLLYVIGDTLSAIIN